MSGTVRTKAEVLAHVQALIAGVQKHFTTSSLTLGNVPMTPAALVTLLKGLIDALDAVDVAQAATRDAQSKLTTTKSQVDPVIRALEHLVRATFGNVVESLADFDLAPNKARRKLTSEEKAAAAQRGAATRKLRGTKGPRQKAALKAPPVPTTEPTKLA